VINAAMIGLAAGAVIVVGMTGLLVYAGIRKQVRYVWKRALLLDIFGMVLLVVCVVYLGAQVGPCNNNLTC
jgi:nitrate reductase gamma subunit